MMLLVNAMLQAFNKYVFMGWYYLVGVRNTSISLLKLFIVTVENSRAGVSTFVLT